MMLFMLMTLPCLAAILPDASLLGNSVAYTQQACACSWLPCTHLELEDASLVFMAMFMCPKHLEQGHAVAVLQA
jgi:hypothetical protein